MDAKFEDLKGKTIIKAEGLNVDSDEIRLYDSEGFEYIMNHSQSCCERVFVQDVIGDKADIIDSEILLAEEVTGIENPDYKEELYDSYTWTFYKLATNKGSLTIRWLGESNGYYGEEVDFYKRKARP